ncbi:MAG: hypothetical protein MJE68_07060 [Proteobacteria bacterium]|nr:hypothetical protein [Pseudomonadota bacterium]
MIDRHDQRNTLMWHACRCEAGVSEASPPPPPPPTIPACSLDTRPLDLAIFVLMTD